jgi:hypothetical protein
MNGEDRLHRKGNTETPFRIPKKERKQGGLPIVSVNNIRSKFGKTHGLDDRLAEEDESVRIVLVVALSVTVRKAPVEEFIPANKKERQVAPGREGEHIPRKVLISHLDFQSEFSLSPQNRRIQKRVAVSRQKDRDLVTSICKSDSERPDCVGKPPCLHVRVELASGVNDLQGGPAFPDELKPIFSQILSADTPVRPKVRVLEEGDCLFDTVRQIYPGRRQFVEADHNKINPVDTCSTKRASRHPPFNSQKAQPGGPSAPKPRPEKRRSKLRYKRLDRSCDFGDGPNSPLDIRHRKPK